MGLETDLSSLLEEDPPGGTPSSTIHVPGVLIHVEAAELNEPVMLKQGRPGAFPKQARNSKWPQVDGYKLASVSTNKHSTAQELTRYEETLCSSRRRARSLSRKEPETLSFKGYPMQRQQTDFERFMTLGRGEAEHLAELKGLLEGEYPEIVKDDWFLLRFSRARKTASESAKLARSALQWREEYKPERVRFNKHLFENELKTGGCFWHKHDKLGRPCGVMLARTHFPRETTPENTLRYLVYNLEGSFKRMREAGASQYVIIYDMKKFSYTKNLDTEALPSLAALQDYYPEVLGDAYIINTDWLFKTFLAMLKAVLDKSTMAKIHVLKNAKTDLLEYFEPENLLPEHGGTSDFHYSYSLDASDDEAEEPSPVLSHKEKEIKKKAGKRHRKKFRKEEKGTELVTSNEELEDFLNKSLNQVRTSQRALTVSGSFDVPSKE